MNRLRTTLALLLTLAWASVLVAPSVSAAPGNAGHCADHQTLTKVEAGASPATVMVTDTTTGDPIEVVVTISGTTFEVMPTDPDITLIDASWCVKASNESHDVMGTMGTSQSTNKHGNVQDVSYVVLYSVTSEVPAVPCNQLVESGNQGFFSEVHELGTTGPTSFEISYETFNIPDRLRIEYEGVEIFNTGFVGENATRTVNVPAGTSSQVTVFVDGPNTGTAWEYTVFCPAA